MSGYTPVFKSVFQGSLCGKYPDTAAWLMLLALADKNGEIDSTPQYISAITGMPVDILQECIERFMQPDPMSRTPDNDGRRLELIDPDRGWGWRLVNHGKYREKARQAAQSVRQIEDGRNAEKVRRYKERQVLDTTGHRETPQDTAGHRQTPPDTLSNANTNANTNTVFKTTMSSSQANPTAVDRIFDHWRTTHGHQRARLDDRRRRLIASALKSYDEASLCQAITGYLNSPFHQGQNDRNTKYDQLEHMLRDARQVDAGLRFYEQPPPNLSKLTRANATAVENWKPPELRAVE